MRCTINGVAATLRQVSRYLDEISFLPELDDPHSTRIDINTDGETCVTVYLAAYRVAESDVIERLLTLAGLLGGQFFLSGPIEEYNGGTFRTLDVQVAIPTGGTLKIWSPIAHADPAPVVLSHAA
ncbi:hypothetical protein [Catenulispora rubra]|uniref:hypothetical protein n=1 Tax=Catenulispora rubra TaxID=280293 RepID=UPI001892702D|nr:hypothetical protein [Catenulispora rubra]